MELLKKNFISDFVNRAAQIRKEKKMKHLNDNKKIKSFRQTPYWKTKITFNQHLKA
jgi:hypothetical protein